MRRPAAVTARKSLKLYIENPRVSKGGKSASQYMRHSAESALVHDIGSDSLCLKLLNINACGNKVSTSGSQEGELREIAELGEFKLALRAASAREALSFVHPWNKSISAIEGFLLQSNICHSDLKGVEKPAVILTQFVDYIFGENADRWRVCEPFISAGELLGFWSSFFRARPVQGEAHPCCQVSILPKLS